MNFIKNLVQLENRGKSTWWKKPDFLPIFLPFTKFSATFRKIIENALTNIKKIPIKSIPEYSINQFRSNDLSNFSIIDITLLEIQI